MPRCLVARGVRLVSAASALGHVFVHQVDVAVTHCHDQVARWPDRRETLLTDFACVLSVDFDRALSVNVQRTSNVATHRVQSCDKQPTSLPFEGADGQACSLVSALTVQVSPIVTFPLAFDVKCPFLYHTHPPSLIVWSEVSVAVS